MVTIRPYQKADAICVGRLIADTFTKYNLSHIPSKDIGKFLGPFAYAYSDDPQHQRDIATIIIADIIYVAEGNGCIAGILRGRHDKLQSLFVGESYQRQGIGRRLVQTFEYDCRKLHANAIKVQATLYAVPFYLAQGYKKTTGVRQMNIFEGFGLPYQPMKKSF